MIVCIDIGNTQSKIGWYVQNECKFTAIVDDVVGPEHLNLFDSSIELESVVISSVHRSDRINLEAFSAHCEVFEVNHRSDLPIVLDYETPETLGIDRICGVVAARRLFSGQDCLVIDAGTCITYDLINKEGTYLGGSIHPGVQMRLDAMHHGTARLPKLNFNPSLPETGKSTAGCMQVGAGLGAIGEMNHLIGLYRSKYPQLQVVLTGGMQSFFEQHVENAIFAAPNLVLDGLNAIWLHNNNR